MEILRVRNLKLGFPRHLVIKGASFSVDQGDFVAVVGANGSGKSTLIRGILGLTKPLSGKVEFLNGCARESVGYLPQETAPDRMFPATVAEIVLTGALPALKTRVCYGEAEKQRSDEVLKLLGISKLKNESFNSLSGGQKQKVLLARALISAGKLLILDEPSNNLDQSSKTSFYELLKKLNNANGLTILMITHDIDADDLIGNKVLSIENGETSMYSTKEYLRRYRHV